MDDDDRGLLIEALELERQAVRRYVAHAAATEDPRLVAYWESLRRNEAGHRDLLVAELRRLGAAVPPEAPHGGAGGTRGEDAEATGESGRAGGAS